MFRCRIIRALLIIAALATAPYPGHRSAAQQPASESNPAANTSVHLRWGPRPGVSRYRLQLAGDRNFSDVVFDRVVNGNEIVVDDLAPGRYFWRVAALTTTLGDFSSAGVIDVRDVAAPTVARPTPATPNRVDANSISAGGGWRAALGDVGGPVAARLRSADKPDVLVASSTGVVFALDAGSGVALWNTRPLRARNSRTAVNILVVPGRSRLDNVVVLSEALAIMFEGATGRELWRSVLPAATSSGAVVFDQTATRLILVDHSRLRLFVLNETSGAVAAQINLTGRVVGQPTALREKGKGSFAVALDTGEIEIRDLNGAVTRQGNASSVITTAPLFVRGRSGDLMLVGTRDGLTALTFEDLRPLGRTSIKDDAPRGALTAQDVDGDGVPEVFMSTERRHLIAVNASDGKIIWDVADAGEGNAPAFADLNRDHVLDVLVSGGRRFALALSGRDGTVVWKDDRPPALATNHAVTFEARSLIALPFGSGMLLIAVDENRSGLRALAFDHAEIRPGTR